MKDSILSPVVKKHGDPANWQTRSDSLFQDLVENIISQQLSDKAGATIIERFKAVVLGSKSSLAFPSAREILKVSDRKMRKSGMSFAKAGFIKGLAAEVAGGSLKLDRLSKMPDEDVISELTKIKGIGRWTAEMFLIFSLRRMDVFSSGDLGLRRAIEKLYKVKFKKEKEYAGFAKRWSPYRSLASWYLWRSLEK